MRKEFILSEILMFVLIGAGISMSSDALMFLALFFGAGLIFLTLFFYARSVRDEALEFFNAAESKASAKADPWWNAYETRAHAPEDMLRNYTSYAVCVQENDNKHVIQLIRYRYKGSELYGKEVEREIVNANELDIARRVEALEEKAAYLEESVRSQEEADWLLAVENNHMKHLERENLRHIMKKAVSSS